MSATLEAEPLRAFLAGTRAEPQVRSEGRRFDVAIEHLPVAQASDDRPLERRIVGAVRQLLREEPDGDLLVFLPGAGEIRRAQAALGELPEAAELAILPLHGEMPLEEQTRAVRPADRRKVVLATNVAESSVTIDGVVAVVDAGLARVAAHSPWTGLPTLALAEDQPRAADQRAGRAGGRARDARCAFTPGTTSISARPTILPRSPASTSPTWRWPSAGSASPILTPQLVGAAAGRVLGRGGELLRRLGAISAPAIHRHRPADAPLSVHPRLARLVCEGERAARARPRALGAALITERDIRRRRARLVRRRRRRRALIDVADSADLVDLYREAEKPVASAPTCWPARAGRPRARRWAGCGGSSAQRSTAAARASRARPRRRRYDMAILASFPDRVARRREPDGKRAARRGRRRRAGPRADGRLAGGRGCRRRSQVGTKRPVRTRPTSVSARASSPTGCWISLPTCRRDRSPRLRPAHGEGGAPHRPGVRRADPRRAHRAGAARRGDRAAAGGRGAARGIASSPAARHAGLAARITSRARPRPRRRCRRWARTPWRPRAAGLVGRNSFAELATPGANLGQRCSPRSPRGPAGARCPRARAHHALRRRAVPVHYVRPAPVD